MNGHLNPAFTSGNATVAAPQSNDVSQTRGLVIGAPQPGATRHNGQQEEPPAVLALTVAYAGSGFHGFARQPNQRTVQGVLEQALEIVFHHEVLTTGAGRTDAGVHALGQVVSFELPASELAQHSLTKMRNSLNALTPDGLVIRAIEQKPAGFSARFSAVEREYRYRVCASPVPPLFLAPYAWWLPTSARLDVNAMRAAAKALVGEHDFASFCVAKSAEGKTTMRNVHEVYLFGTQHLGEHSLNILVRGNAFLHSMVRVIVGSLVEVGLHNREACWLGQALEARDRQAAGPTAPAHGLTFWQVKY
jgi:tRNA pseudouridine38-40 synthase